MGTIGLETAFAAVYTELVLPGVLPLALVVDKLSSGAALVDLPLPAIRVGEGANFCLIDLDAEYEVGEAGYESRSENCCFAGRRLRGRVLATVAAGAVAYRRRSLSVVGAALGATAQLTRRLGAGMVAHALLNGVVFVVVLVT